MRQRGWHRQGLRRREALSIRIALLEVVVGERPVRYGGTLDRTELGKDAEVVLTEARELSVGVHSSATDRGRQVVHVTNVDPIAVVLVLRNVRGSSHGSARGSAV